MFSSETVSREMSNQQSSKHFSVEGKFLKSREFMGSDFFTSLSQQNQQNPGLARYRSAPSSFLATLFDATADNSSSGDESEALFSAIWNGPRNMNQKGSDNDGSSQMQYHMKQEIGAEPEDRSGQNGFSNGLVGYESAVAGGGGNVVGSYSVGNESQGHHRMNCGNGANSSNVVSSAGFFNGFGVMGEVGNYSSGLKTNTNSVTATGVSNSHLNFSSGQSLSPRFMPSIPENGSIRPREHRKSRNGDAGEFEATFSHETWNESSPSNGLKRNHDGNLKMSNFNGLENQNGEGRKNVPTLVHHLSLPKTSSSSMGGEVEKFNFLQFQQDTVPCQVRAKRGCATHPRSIAERVRRTRISEKMKKLQDLFPTMDKQTSTADMLDSAVEYIKDLQKQVQTLTETKAKCVCLSKHHATSPAGT